MDNTTTQPTWQAQAEAREAAEAARRAAGQAAEQGTWVWALTGQNSEEPNGGWTTLHATEAGALAELHNQADDGSGEPVVLAEVHDEWGSRWEHPDVAEFGVGTTWTLSRQEVLS